MALGWVSYVDFLQARIFIKKIKDFNLDVFAGPMMAGNWAIATFAIISLGSWYVSYSVLNPFVMKQ